jgi:hypothetical protein
MLLDQRGHLKLTDLGLCKKVGEVSPEDHPEFVLDSLRQERNESNPNNSYEFSNNNNNNHGELTTNLRQSKTTHGRILEDSEYYDDDLEGEFDDDLVEGDLEDDDFAEDDEEEEKEDDDYYEDDEMEEEFLAELADDSEE